MKRLSLENKKKGMITIISYDHSHIQPSGQKRAMWNAQCECGKKFLISTSNFTHGKSISCGCYIKKIRKNGTNKKPIGQANFNYKFLSYKNRAKNHSKKLKFDLTKEQFKEIILKNCFYCNEKPKMHHTKRSYNGEFISNGIDRINPSIGYILNNCVPCCKICNIMKNKYEINFFISHLKRILNYVSTK